MIPIVEVRSPSLSVSGRLRVISRARFSNDRRATLYTQVSLHLSTQSTREVDI